MTTIAYRAGVLAADTQMIQGTSVIGQTVKIVRRKDGVLCGGAGDLAWVQGFQRWFLEGEEGDPPPLDDASKGLIIRPKKPIEMFEEFGAIEWTSPFVAIGSGKEFALGAMYVGATAEQAVRAAMVLDPFTGGKVMKLRHAKA
jgi:ATP-dependent protease HslVU (ClpYQ) peptidase subunit